MVPRQKTHRNIVKVWKYYVVSCTRTEQEVHPKYTRIETHEGKLKTSVEKRKTIYPYVHRKLEPESSKWSKWLKLNVHLTKFYKP